MYVLINNEWFTPKAYSQEDIDQLKDGKRVPREWVKTKEKISLELTQIWERERPNENAVLVSLSLNQNGNGIILFKLKGDVAQKRF